MADDFDAHKNLAAVIGPLNELHNLTLRKIAGIQMISRSKSGSVR